MNVLIYETEWCLGHTLTPLSLSINNTLEIDYTGTGTGISNKYVLHVSSLIDVNGKMCDPIL